MKETRRRYEMFSVFNRSGLERRLARMAEKGWLLDEIGQVFWTYRRIEPKKLTFSVCYFPEASAYDPEPSEERQTFYDFCAHAGWILAASSAQLQIFYNEREDPVPIETDPVTEVESIHRMAKSYFLPCRFAVMAMALMYGWMLADLWGSDPVRVLADGSLFWTGIALLGAFVLCVLDVARYYLWRAGAKKAAEWGELLPAPGYFRVRWLLGLWIMASLAAGLLSLPGLTAAAIGVRAVGVCAVVLLIYSGRQLLKERKVPAKTSRVVCFAACFILSFLVMTAALWLEQEGRGRNWFGDGCETYEHDGQTYVCHQDELRLTVEDLISPPGARYCRELRESSSPLAARTTGCQAPRFGEEDYDRVPQLTYIVVRPRLPFLYSLCWEGQLHRWDDQGRVDGAHQKGYEPMDPAPWGAAEAYRQMYGSGRPANRYLLRYEGRVVELVFDFGEDGPTPAQMAVVGEKLGR